MSEFLTFLHLGFRHIIDVQGVDHILFLFALAAIYRWNDWRDALWVATAFTVGHSVTLAIAVTHAMVLPTELVEFLIPLTIVATGVENLFVRDRAAAPLGRRYRPVFAGIFGLVHGAGFANYLTGLFVERIAVPLFGFNVGIEIGQIVVLVGVAVTLWLIDWAITALRLPATLPAPHRVRVLAISAAVALVAVRMAVERSPW